MPCGRCREKHYIRTKSGPNRPINLAEYFSRMKRVLKNPFEYSWPVMANEAQVLEGLLGILPKALHITGMNNICGELQKIIDGGANNIECVFLCKGDESISHMYAHLPVMAQLAQVLLKGFHKKCSNQIAKKLGLNNVLVIAILSCPESKELLKIVDKKRIDMEYLDEIRYQKLRVQDIPIKNAKKHKR